MVLPTVCCGGICCYLLLCVLAQRHFLVAPDAPLVTCPVHVGQPYSSLLLRVIWKSKKRLSLKIVKSVQGRLFKTTGTRPSQSLVQCIGFPAPSITILLCRGVVQGSCKSHHSASPELPSPACIPIPVSDVTVDTLVLVFRIYI